MFLSNLYSPFSEGIFQMAAPFVEKKTILLVEDNIADIRLIQNLLKDINVQATLQVATDGVMALSYLHQQGNYADVELPDLILLDWNLPKKNGYEVLTEVKGDPLLKHIPVIVLTTSDAESDVLAAYNNYASSYLIKPVDLDNFIKVIKYIESFWLQLVRLPAKKSHE